MNRSRLLKRLTSEQTALMAVATLAVFGAGALWMYDPATSRFFPPCPFHAVTGYLCPGCGTLRALHQLLQGHLASAFRLNPLMVVSLPFVGYSGLSSGIEAAAGRSLPHPFVPPRYIWLLLAAIVLFWILRNTPFFPAA